MGQDPLNISLAKLCLTGETDWPRCCVMGTSVCVCVCAGSGERVHTAQASPASHPGPADQGQAEGGHLPLPGHLTTERQVSTTERESINQSLAQVISLQAVCSISNLSLIHI